ncbi:MAG: PQQ-dependent dehydrogenase (methanol/ethanol family) [Gammaproteobacteria bacterium]|jgi:PQQ-dependent dehydrogenase (methanol/ethanol family)
MSKISFKSVVIAAIALVVPVVASANDEVRTLTQNPNYWAFPGGNYDNHRFSALKQINSGNAGKVVTAWTFSTGVLRGHEGGPLVLPSSATGLPGDTLYIHAAFPNNTFAIDLDTLGIIWHFEPQQDFDVTVPVMCCDTVNRGLGYSMGQIYLQQADTTLVALNAKTGAVVWTAQNGGDIPASLGGPYGPTSGMTNTNAPHPIKDKIITGCSGAEFGVRCWLAAYNAKDGSLAWRAFSMGPDADMLFDANTTSLGKKVGKDSSLNSWKGDQWKQGGGSTWGWWPADFNENLVYYGNGNPGTWNPVVRPGDNKWSMSMFARDIDTGVAKWVYQMTPHDEWDYDGVNEMILADFKVGGKMTKALVHFDRNGFGYTMDRVSGALLVAEKYDPAVNWATGVDLKTGLPQRVASKSTHGNGEDVVSKDICPAALGTKDEQPAAYSPDTGLFYVPTNHVCMTYEPVSYAAGGNEYVSGQAFVNANLTMYPAGAVCPDCPNNNAAKDNMGNMIAWDASTGKIVWSIPEQYSVWSGVLATAGGVVYYGNLEGWAKAVDATSGKLLWKFKTPSGIIGNFNSWAHNGKQYVGVLSGIGGWAGAVAAIPGLAAAPDTAALGAVGGYRGLLQHSRAGGTLMVFALP